MIPTIGHSVPVQSSVFAPEIVVQLALAVVVVAGMWKAFDKAGEPGWAAIVPIYNIYVITKIGGNAWWWVLLTFVPVLNLLALAKISVDLAGVFDYGLLFGLGLAFLPFVFYPILGFGESRPQPPAA